MDCARKLLQRYGPWKAVPGVLVVLLAALPACTDENQGWDVGHPCTDNWECKSDICHLGFCWCQTDDCKTKDSPC